MNDAGGWVNLAVDDPDTGYRSVIVRTTKQTDRDKYNTAIFIDWVHSTTDYDQFLTSDEKKRLDKFDELIEQVDNDEKISMLVLMVLKTVSREWVVYTSDYAAWIKRFNTVFEMFSQLPISIEYSLDPQWQYWKHFSQHIPTPD